MMMAFAKHAKLKIGFYLAPHFCHNPRRGHYEERSPKLGFESWPKFPGNPGIEIFLGKSGA